MSRQSRALIVLSIGIGCQLAVAEQNHKTWSEYGGGSDSSKYVALNQFTKANVTQLQAVWTYPVRDGNAYLFNPVIVDNIMYVLARNNSLVALDAVSGKEIWVHENLRGIAPRGINYWESKDRKDRRLIFQMNHFLQEIDAGTGKSILTFGANGLVNLKEGLGRDPKTIGRVQSSTPGRVFENLIIMGSATGENYFATPGDVRAFDVISGKQVWSFHTIPHPGEFGYETWPKDAWKYSGGTNTWGEITVDDKRAIAYFPLGSPTYDYYGADRIGSNLFANCLLALDARTGKRIWHYQIVHHDLWDYDATSAPQLITVRHDGKQIDAVAQASKQGFLYVLDRVTGKPLWPIEERPAPKSDMPGEQAWPTQPFPTAPPPFTRQKVTPADVNPYLLTPEERSNWKDRIASARSGIFTPPSLQAETIAMPGARGGSNWGTTAANPEKGLVFVSTQDWPSFYKMSADPPSGGGGGRGVAGQEGQAVYARTCQACHGADRAGSVAVPSVVGITRRLNFLEFRQLVLNGKGEMPAFPDLDGAGFTALYARLSELDGTAQPGRGPFGAAVQARAFGGPVVASGGAPGGLDAQPVPFSGGGMTGPAYPEGIEVPPSRYYTGYGLDFPHVMSPPWSSLVAYDLNKGTIAWRVALGEDSQAIAEGAKDAGMLAGGEHHGMVVTSTGLIFIATRDAKIRAFDQDNGKVLWTATLPGGSEGIPAMYEVGGRQFLVVSASSTVQSGRRPVGGGRGPAPTLEETNSGRGYVVFSLPEKSK